MHHLGSVVTFLLLADLLVNYRMKLIETADGLVYKFQV